MSKTTDEILVFLVRNSHPEYHKYPITPEIAAKYHKTKPSKWSALLLSASGTTRYLCPVKTLEEFLGETLSFEAHLRPLMADGTLFFSGVPAPGDIYDSPSYRKAFDHATGRVASYSGTDKGESWVAFHYREHDFLRHHDRLLDNAVSLGLLR